MAPPRLPLTRYHGVLAPNSSWRRAIVSGARQTDNDTEPRCAQQDRAKPQQSRADVSEAEAPKPRSRTSTSYVPWSELMKRTLGINVLQCPVCEATMVLLAVIAKREVIDRFRTPNSGSYTPSNNSASETLYARARPLNVAKVTLTFPASMSCKCFGSIPAALAAASWVQPKSLRTERTRSPRRASAASTSGSLRAADFQAVRWRRLGAATPCFVDDQDTGWPPD